MKYGVKILFEDTELFVTDGKVDNIKPILYNSYNEALELAKAFGENARVVEVNKLESQDKFGRQPSPRR